MEKLEEQFNDHLDTIHLDSTIIHLHFAVFALSLSI